MVVSWVLFRFLKLTDEITQRDKSISILKYALINIENVTSNILERIEIIDHLFMVMDADLMIQENIIEKLREKLGRLMSKYSKITKNDTVKKEEGNMEISEKKIVYHMYKSAFSRFKQDLDSLFSRILMYSQKIT